MTAAAPTRGRTLAVMALATGVHSLSAASLFVIPAIAPDMAAALGTSTSLVGIQVAVVYFGATTMSVFAGSLAVRFGPARACQAGLLLGVAGLAAASSGWLPLVALASLLLGLGYGMINPPTGYMVERVATAGNRGFLFSVKQTAVPAGGMLAGLVGPPVTLLWNWQAALLAMAGCLLLAIVLLQPLTCVFKASPAIPAVGRPPLLRDLQLVWRVPALRWATLAATALAGVQFTLTTFLVALLVEDIHFDLVAAGIGLSVFQAAALIGRLSWGLLADFTRSGLIVLLVAFAVAIASLLALTAMTTAWPLWVLYLCLAALGAAAAGWNGVFVSEVVRMSPPGGAARAIGGAFAFTFAGALVVPATFSGLYEWSHSYTITAWLLVVLAVGGALSLLAAIALARKATAARLAG